jgi:DinB superfamily
MSTSAEQEVNRSGMEARLLNEGYGPGAWHGPDLKAAIADVAADVAWWRPAPGRHNIAEVALHHAYCIRNVRAQISGAPPEPFVLDGDDWFELNNGSALSWPDVRATLEAQHGRLVTLVGDIEAGRVRSPLSEADVFSLVLGITCHAVYHAGQIQLIKRLKTT